MKKLILLFLTLFVINSCISQEEFVVSYSGEFPIIITSGHGGTIKKDYIVDRDCENNNCNSDMYTQSLSKLIKSTITKEFDKTPYFIYNRLHRKEVDVNREANVAYRDITAGKVYNIYHEEIEQAIIELNSAFPQDFILLLDIHGHTHSHGMVELGYDVPTGLLATGSYKDIYGCTLNPIKDFSLEELIIGKKSLGTFLQRYVETVPSDKNLPITGSYFNGGYTIERYKQKKNVIAIQVEIPSAIRMNHKARVDFALSFAKSLKKFYNKIN